MTRSLRLVALPLALLLLVAMVAVALANRGGLPPSPALQPGASAEVQAQDAEEEEETPPTAEELEHAADRLRAAGLTVDDAQLADLAGRYGQGGAVRLLAWSAETGMAVEDIARMRDGTEGTEPMGWGRIAKELGVHPGIGSIMGGGNAGGNGKGNGPPARPGEGDGG